MKDDTALTILHNISPAAIEEAREVGQMTDVRRAVWIKRRMAKLREQKRSIISSASAWEKETADQRQRAEQAEATIAKHLQTIQTLRTQLAACEERLACMPELALKEAALDAKLICVGEHVRKLRALSVEIGRVANQISQ